MPADMPPTTKGELLIRGLAQVQEGLAMIGRAGPNNEDLIKLLATNQHGARQLRELLKGQTIFRAVVMGLVKSRNRRLADDTIEKIIGDFLAVLEDLASPMAEPDPEGLPAE